MWETRYYGGCSEVDEFFIEEIEGFGMYIPKEKEIVNYKEPRIEKSQVACTRQMNAPIQGRNY